MKPVFKCDYCDFVGTKEVVENHEMRCIDNYNRRSCNTCEYKKYKSMYQLECKAGREIPEKMIYESCGLYKRKEEPKNPLTDLFGGMFGM